MSDEKGFAEYKLLLLDNIKRLDTSVKELRVELSDLRGEYRDQKWINRLIILLVGTTSGGVGAGITQLIKMLLNTAG